MTLIKSVLCVVILVMVIYTMGSDAAEGEGSVKLNPDDTECPPDKPPVYCIVSPCSYATCPEFKKAKCVPYYCGGCYARWYLGNAEVTDRCFK